MAGAAVSVSTGAINSLLWKLNTLLDAEDAKLPLKGTLRHELPLLRDEVDIMKVVLQSFAKREESTAQLKQWMRQVREMVYDIEDWIDERWRPHRSEADHKNLRGSMKGRVLKAVKMKLTPGSDEGASDQIRAFTERIKEAYNRQERYKLERTTSIKSTDTAADLVSDDGSANNSRPRAHCEGEISPVGIQDQTDKLVNQIRGEEQRLMVVSLVGFGGLGKTTLAKQVYRKLQEQFGCRAFVCAGRNTSVKAVLMKIRNQVRREPYAGVEPLNEQQLIQDLEQFLKDKKYFIVVDDLWSSTAWQVIKCALPDNDHGSRIIITTRVRDVAASSRIYESDLVHYVEPLSAADSITLFNSRFDSDGSCPAQETVDLVSERCGGVPLAIITMAGLLASKPAGKQQQTAVLSTQEHLDADGMRKVLYHCYSDLSHHLKTCLLYMCVFPEAYKIRKDHLVRRWIAEGFVCERGGESLQDIGEGYLNDLIARNLVQQVIPIDDDNDDDQEEGYMVHDMVRELIISLSVEENFVTVPAQWINLIPHDKIRRLSLQYSNQEVAPALPSGAVLSHVRSLTIFGRDEGKSDLSKFPNLRVVDLQGTDKLENDDVKSIAKLYQLRYLGLGGKGISTLPEQIGELQNMETLDLRQTDVRELPASLTRLTKLMHLLVTNAKLPAGLGDMEHLQELSMVSVSKTSFPDSVDVEELKKLKKLRTLGLNWCVADGDSNVEDYRKSLVSTLNDLGDSSLQCITLDTDNGKNKLDFLLDSWKPPYLLQKFKLRRSDYYFSRVPAKMEGHIKLTYLEIGITQVRNDDLTLLSNLPALIILKLRSSGASSEESFKISSVGFKHLQQFWFMRRDKGIGGVEFDEGAMPKLRMLRLHCNLHGAKSLPAAFNFGMKHLNCLKQVRVKIDCDGIKVAEVVAAEAAIREATDVPPTCELEFII